MCLIDCRSQRHINLATRCWCGKESDRPTQENNKRAYTLVIGQCSPDLNSKLQGSSAFVQAKADQDCAQLLLVIRGFCCRFNDNQQSTYALKQAKHQVSMYYQAQDVTNTEHVEHFKALVSVVETYGGAYD